MKTRIIVESTSDLLLGIKERVHVVPLTVRFGEEEYIDGVTINHRVFMRSWWRVMCFPPQARLLLMPLQRNMKKLPRQVKVR